MRIKRNIDTLMATSQVPVGVEISRLNSLVMTDAFRSNSTDRSRSPSSYGCPNPYLTQH